MTNIYVVYRRRRGKLEYWCRDTARCFWWPVFDPDWVDFVLSPKEAKEKLDLVAGACIARYKYGILTEGWSEEKVRRHAFAPLDGVPIKRSTY